MPLKPTSFERAVAAGILDRKLGHRVNRAILKKMALSDNKLAERVRIANGIIWTTPSLKEKNAILLNKISALFQEFPEKERKAIAFAIVNDAMRQKKYYALSRLGERTPKEIARGLGVNYKNYVVPYLKNKLRGRRFTKELAKRERKRMRKGRPAPFMVKGLVDYDVHVAVLRGNIGEIRTSKIYVFYNLALHQKNLANLVYQSNRTRLTVVKALNYMMNFFPEELAGKIRAKYGKYFVKIGQGQRKNEGSKARPTGTTHGHALLEHKKAEYSGIINSLLAVNSLNGIYTATKNFFETNEQKEIAAIIVEEMLKSASEFQRNRLIMIRNALK